MWVGVDDTDGPSGGCTTFVLTELIRTARDRGVDLIGEPRLVRLNPNIPWKTRGNAALSLHLGRGSGSRRALGEIGGRRVWSYARGTPVARPAEIEAALWETVLASSAHDEGTDPAMVVADRPLPSELYRAAVRSVVAIETVEGALRTAGAHVRHAGSKRGIVGAAAALAWPARRATWELIAYRSPAAEGRRAVDADSVRSAQQRFPSLFLCYDDRTRRLLVAPHTPCPILFGLRSTERGDLPRAARVVRSEPVDRWLVFRTNQGTGDHLRMTRSAELAPFGAGIVEGIVSRAPVGHPGGHVALELQELDGTVMACRVFEPTKTLPAVARSLRPGDRVRLWGGRARDPVFRVEGIVIRATAPRRRAVGAPRCPTCRRRTHSMGQARGFRCAHCRTRLPPEARSLAAVAPEFGRGTYHPTPSARRHLAPLARG
jgi:tRNA(Ile2)-agmatinylcytidine synthase